MGNEKWIAQRQPDQSLTGDRIATFSTVHSSSDDRWVKNKNRQHPALVEAPAQATRKFGRRPPVA